MVVHPLKTPKGPIMTYCHTCKTFYNAQGIGAHRAAHLNRGESVTETSSSGTTTHHPE